jgi:hypothetical protein
MGGGGIPFQIRKIILLYLFCRIFPQMRDQGPPTMGRKEGIFSPHATSHYWSTSFTNIRPFFIGSGFLPVPILSDLNRIRQLAAKPQVFRFLLLSMLQD